MSFWLVKEYPRLYKRDTTGRVRSWCMALGQDSNCYAYCTISGLVDGEKVTSGWKSIAGKNAGKVNETTSQEQAIKEIEAQYTKRRDTGYFDNIEDIDKFKKFKPMLAHDYAKRGVDWSREVFSQPKLDGARCIARNDALWTRGGKKFVSVPHIHEALLKTNAFMMRPDVVFDGELYNHDLKDNFNKLMSLARKTKPTQDDLDESAELIEYHLYDLHLSDSPHMLFEDRFYMLETLVASMHEQGITCIKAVPTKLVDDQIILDNLNGEYVASGYEGQMVRYNSAYENKRSTSLLKRKEFDDNEFDVVRIEEGQGNWAGYIKRFVVNVDGKEVGCGVRGSQAVLKDLFESEFTPDWAKVRYFGRTPDGSLRFPVVIDWGQGKRED